MKYEVGVKARLEDDASGDKQIKRNAKKAKSELNVQIAQLVSVIVAAEDEVENRQEAYEASKYRMPFSLGDVDDADFELQRAVIKLKERQDDLKNRRALLKELF